MEQSSDHLRTSARGLDGPPVVGAMAVRMIVAGAGPKEDRTVVSTSRELGRLA